MPIRAARCEASPPRIVASGAGRRLFTVAAPLGLLALAIRLGIPLCPSAIVLRLPCPGCGLSRAALALLRGDLHAASGYQPLAIVVLPALGAALGWIGLRYVLTARSNPPRWALVSIIGTFVLLFAVWAARLLGAFGGPVPV